MGLAELTTLFGWMTVINLAVYIVTALCVTLGRNRITRLQTRLTGLGAEDWPRAYVDYLSRYKLLILVFNLTPYLALRIVG